ncbi:Nif3-like dinuclear metal center hexameric protein [Helicobacter kayseriensis]|uniref:Nif3-like dinuclear metal center hexameric protein n=1 Tax=Helicobacter kayseriensis TaxID=2905877 RepID=UPI001E2B2331|nr:Nif3-like dinuclear metal center hexameric protein [Helicobacter kayseriensis]MCE3047105.1 Nif3-like dinuclear metal center hexameric protein [Helicobacter kayseriensis]MCE3048235.1 Nif3-like dinuclear metal center hexameric protein [Helicobacter kayseriensis]
MQVQEIYSLLNEISPFSLQEQWDNSGINLGNPLQEFENIYTTLEVDMHLAQQIKPNSLIIAHHPLIFSPLKNLNTQSYPSNIASILLAKNCSLIAMHTNFDRTHLNHYFASQILGFQNLIEKDYILSARLSPQSFETLLTRLKIALNASIFKALKASEKISQVFIVCGSGMSFLKYIPPHSQSCFITGDIKHHEAMEAQSLGISLIDVGHFESEVFFAQVIAKILQNFGYEAIINDLKNPLKFY